MKIAFQIDKIGSLNTKTDSSLLIMNECKRRGFDVWFYHPSALTFKNGEVFANCFKYLGLQVEKESEVLLLESFNFVFLRQNPPFDMAYLTTTYLLERLKKAKVLNNPASVRSSPEKLFVLDFAQFMPKTIITASEEEIKAFWKECGEVILKPLYSFGGGGVFYISKTDKNLANAIAAIKQNYGVEAIIAQEYLPAVKEGDKRILFINGEVAGAFNRVQAEDSVLSGIVSGAKPAKASITAEEEEICKALSPKLKELGLFLTGIDVIGGKMTEINVTSPTGFPLLNILYGGNIEQKIVVEMLQL